MPRRSIARRGGFRVILALACLPALWRTAAAQATAPAAQTAAGDDFTLQGEYRNETLGVQVVAGGDGKFTAVLCKGGLPGAGWDGSPRQELDEDADGVRGLIESLGLQRVERRSPTLGAAPPAGAIVLFDGAPASLAAHWRPGARIDAVGLLAQGGTTTDKLRDFSLHVEFRLPFMPAARGQQRGNSGLYLQGRYELQMLDSFGLAGKDDETGGVYSIRDPDLNLCLPPMAWQTYDVDFTAARWDESGKKLSNARVTARLNGVVVQRDVELPRPTPGASLPDSPAPGPIHLQDHSCEVRYRNIWVLPRDADREARRPIVAGFERFHTGAGADAAGGRLLLGELACTQCHQASDQFVDILLPKEPPILNAVGARLRPEWMRKFLADPHGVKPGTTMPDVLSALSDGERRAAAEALVGFLASTGAPDDTLPDPSAARRGERLYHEVGCVQCHAPRNGQTVPQGSSVPLADLGEKYTLPSLLEFLKSPLKVRPSGRMPAWPLNDGELRDVAAYLIGDAGGTAFGPNLTASIYRGDWDALPDFDKLTPVARVETTGFDLSAAGARDGFGVRFEGFLVLEKNRGCTFHLGSDDGSRLTIDGQVIVRNDGVHPYSVRTSGRVNLAEGVHKVVVDYFEKGGDEELTLELEESRLPRQNMVPLLRLRPEGDPVVADSGVAERFTPDPALAGKGRELFSSLGCASCHRLREGKEAVPSLVKARPLDECRPGQGCLSADGAKNVPAYTLSPEQQWSIEAALAEISRPTPSTDQSRIAQVMTAFNCYACHSRDNVGGATRERNELFHSTIPEMGDEGRLPPPLDGVGDKLTDQFLARLMTDGGQDRPYLRTKMPRFGAEQVRPWTAAVARVDRRDELEPPRFDEPDYRVKATGRQLVGDKGLACIKCHTFGPHKATGIQAINLTSMARRLREDWFLRYLRDPNAYRPGTRMPTGFPEGRAAIRDVYHGDADRQITAIWKYLEDGVKAGVPDGLLGELIELKPAARPILYRGFLEGTSPRAIAVGYPEHCHLAWDADRMCLSQIWHGRFLDVSRHWQARGDGFQPPLGDHVVRFEETVPIAALDSPSAPWPDGAPRERGYRFRGYDLDQRGRPTFRYDGPGFSVQDGPEPISAGEAGTFRRKLIVTATADAPNLYFRAARGATIAAQPEGGYLVDGGLRLHITGGGRGELRKVGDQMELLVPVQLGGRPVELVQEIVW